MRAARILGCVAFACAFLIALGLTLARVLQPDGGRWAQLVTLTPFALPLLAGAAVLIVVGRLGLRLPWVYLTPAVAAVVVLLAVNAAWLGPMYVGESRPAAATVPVRVMTANLRLGRADPAALLRAAADAHTDVLALQEVTPAGLAALDAAGIAAAFPSRAGEPKPHASGTMLFARSDLGDVRWLGMTNGAWSATVDVGGRTVRIAAVHPATPLDDRLWRSDLALLGAAARVERYDVIVGDFNATHDHAPLRRVMDLGYRDAAELANTGWAPTWPRFGSLRLVGIRMPPFAQIDHVLVRRGGGASGVRRIVLGGSDHDALVAEVWLPPTAR